MTTGLAARLRCRRASITAGAYRRLKSTHSRHPLDRQASSTSSSSTSVSASGFSHRTWLPARSAAAARVACESCGVAITTTDTSGSSMTAWADGATCSNPTRSARRTALRPDAAGTDQAHPVAGGGPGSQPDRSDPVRSHRRVDELDPQRGRVALEELVGGQRIPEGEPVGDQIGHSDPTPRQQPDERLLVTSLGPPDLPGRVVDAPLFVG